MFRTRVVVVLWIALSVCLQACRERRESFYPTLGDAVTAGEIARGWIPDFLPASSHAIHIIYNPASPRTWCAFDFSSDDSARLRKALSGLDTIPPQLRRVDGPGVSWWPDFLRGGLDAGRIRSSGFDLYVLVEPDVASRTDFVLFAINWSKGQGFFFRTPDQSS